MQDGDAYYAAVATVSLGSSLCLNLYQNRTDGALNPQPVTRILQEPRSLLVTTNKLYRDYLHGIEGFMEDNHLNPETVANWHLLGSTTLLEGGCNVRQTRYSLTYRDVVKVSKLSKLGPLFKR